jgi:translation elongation factor P/translation initiation factor 5A
LLKPADTDVDMPIVERSKGMAIAIVGDQVHVMDEKSYETFIAPKPKDVDVKQGLQVEFLRYGKNVRIIRAAKE